MSSVAFRDSSVVIVETGRTLVRAGLGLHDLLRAPSVGVPARVGVRRASSSKAEDHTATPSVTPSNGAIALSRQQSSHVSSGLRLNDYLVGTQLDSALAAGEDIIVSWPFKEGRIGDFVQAEAIWKYVLFQQLGLKRTQNESPALVTFPHGLAHDEYENVCRIYFERFNVAALSIIDRPLAQIYAANALSGLVVDIGDYMTDITPINDCFVQHNACTSVPIGIRHCELYFAHLLKSNQNVMSTLFPSTSQMDPDALRETLVELARQVWNEGLIKVPSSGEATLDLEEEGVTNLAAVIVAGKEKAIIESNLKKRLNAKATAAEQARAKEIEALDLISVQFREMSLTLGRERHRFCDPLFDPTLLSGVEGLGEISGKLQDVVPLQDACGLAVTKVDLIARPSVWGGLFVTGDITSSVKGIAPALQSRLSPFILSNPDMPSDVQPRYIRVLRVPDYFAEYREKGDRFAAFLGASIVAKVTFSDAYGKNFVSKADYSTLGPRAILDMSPTLL